MSDRDALILRWRPLAVRVVTDLWPRSPRVRRLGWEDAVAWAEVGLVEAADRFDPARGSFGTLAYRCCRGWLARGERLSTLIRLPCRPPRGPAGAEAAARALRCRPLPEGFDLAMPARRAECWPEPLAAARAALPEADRAILAMRYEGGLRERQIASALGVSGKCAKARLRYARRRLRAEYDRISSE